MKKFTEDAIKFKMDDTAELYAFDNEKNRSDDSNFRTVGFKTDGWDGSWIKLVGRSIFDFAAAAAFVIVISCDSLASQSLSPSLSLLLVESLIGLVNRIKRAYMVLTDYGGDNALLTHWEALLFVTVVDGQKSGKPSVLESIIGRDFLPRGSGIVIC